MNKKLSQKLGRALEIELSGAVGAHDLRGSLSLYPAWDGFHNHLRTLLWMEMIDVADYDRLNNALVTFVFGPGAQ